MEGTSLHLLVANLRASVGFACDLGAQSKLLPQQSCVFCPAPSHDTEEHGQAKRRLAGAKDHSPYPWFAVRSEKPGLNKLSLKVISELLQTLAYTAASSVLLATIY